MELVEHVKIIKKHRLFIVIFSVFVTVLSLVFALTKPVSYDAVVSFDVNLVNRQNTTDYQYGAYYDLKGAEVFSQNAMSWLRTPSVIQEIYQDAGFSTDIKNLDNFTNRFKTSQYGAQNFIVSYNDLSKDSAEKIGLSMGKIISKKAAAVSAEDTQNAVFTLTAAKPVVVMSELNKYLMATLGLICGLVFAVILIYLKNYFQSSK